MAAVLALTCLGTAARTEAASIVVNGGFETHDFTGWTMTTGEFTFVCGTGAPFSCDGLEAFSGTGPHSGGNAAALGPAFPFEQGIFQSLPTTTGSLYTLEFWFSVCPQFDCSLNSLSVSWDGMTVYSQTNAPATPWTHVVIPNLLASGPLTDLRFLASNDLSFYLLDDIGVEAQTPATVPEPTTMALLGTGVGMFIMRRRTMTRG